jgi:hypothetical protein
LILRDVLGACADGSFQYQRQASNPGYSPEIKTHPGIVDDSLSLPFEQSPSLQLEHLAVGTQRRSERMRLTALTLTALTLTS